MPDKDRYPEALIQFELYRLLKNNLNESHSTMHAWQTRNRQGSPHTEKRAVLRKATGRGQGSFGR